MATLTQNAIKTKAEKWASLQAKIARLESEKISELTPHQEAYERKTAPIVARFDEQIDPLQEKADELESEILEWLEKQKRSIRLETKNAIAEMVRSKGFGDRVVDAEKFVAKCIERGIKNFWRLVRVNIKDANQVMGKEDMDELCDRPKVETANATLELKAK